MASFGSIIKQLRKDKEMTQDQLASLLKVSRSTIGMYETGNREPDFETCEAIADIFNVDMDYLMGRTTVKKKYAVSPSIVPSGFLPLPATSIVPLVGQIACGEPILAEQNITESVRLPMQWQADFALLCKGDSMAPTVLDGDLVAVKIQPEVENGEIAACRIGGEATLKRVYLHVDYIELRPENPAYESIIRRHDDMNDIHIEGKAVGFCRKL